MANFPLCCVCNEPITLLDNLSNIKGKPAHTKCVKNRRGFKSHPLDPETDHLKEQTWQEKLYSLFVNRKDDYAQQTKNGKYIRSEQPLTPEVLQRHLKGEITVAAYQLNKENKVKELTFDIDPEHNQDPLGTAKKLVNACLEKKRFYPKSVWLEASRYPDPSYHVRILFSIPVLASVARWIGIKLLTFADVNPNTIELFPKQKEIDPDGFGNCIKLPLGLHQREKKWSKFLDLETLQPLPKEAILEAEGVSFSEKDLEKIVQLAEAPPQIQIKLCKTVYKQSKNIRPCIIEALKTDLRGSQEHHKMRLAIATEYLAANYSLEEIRDLFSSQLDYDEKESTTQIEYAKKRGHKPFKCAKIKTLGFCIGEACPIFRRTKRTFERAVEALL